MLWTTSCIGSGVLGWFAGYRKNKKIKEKELTAEEKRVIEREKREIMNFWNYTGDPQS